MNKEIYKPKEFADLIGVSTKTLKNWDKLGKLVAKRTPSNHKFYTKEDLEKYLAP